MTTARGRAYAQFYRDLYRARETLQMHPDLVPGSVHAQIQVTGHYRDPRTRRPYRLHGAVPIPADQEWAAGPLVRFAQMAERRLRTRYDKISFDRIVVRFIVYRETGEET